MLGRTITITRICRYLFEATMLRMGDCGQRARDSVNHRGPEGDGDKMQDKFSKHVVVSLTRLMGFWNLTRDVISNLPDLDGSTVLMLNL